MPADQVFANIVLGAIRSLQHPRRANLVTLGELQRRLGIPSDRLQIILRRLESSGIVMCTPTNGPIAVVNLTADAALADEALAS
jgi:DNA-binding IclR family transcriptional regulator